MISKDQMFMEMAGAISKRGSCNRLQVGCVIVRDDRVISSGCNGPLTRATPCIENCRTDLPCEHAIHAEANAIYAAAKHGISLMGATLYTTHSPCLKCSEAIIQAGIFSVKYVTDFRDTIPLKRLKAASLEIEKYEENPV